MNKKTSKVALLLLVVMLVVTCLVACDSVADTFSVTIKDGEETIATVKVTDGNDAEITAKAVKEGYVLEGLYKDAAFTEKFDLTTATIDSDLTLYAKFVGKSYSIIVNANGGSAVAKIGVTKGEAYTVPASEREGYDFLCYTYLDDDGKEQEFDLTGTYTFDYDQRLTAQWAKKTFTVTLYDDEGAEAREVTVEYGAKLAEIPQKEDYIFTGWYEGTGDDAVKVEANTEIKRNYTLTAHYIAKAYTISYTINAELNGGVGVERYEVAYNTVPAIVEPTRSGFVFAGWTLNGEAFDPTAAFTALENITIEAHWKQEDTVLEKQAGNYFTESDGSETTYVFLTYYTYDLGGVITMASEDEKYFELIKDGENIVKVRPLYATPEGVTVALTKDGVTNDVKIVSNVSTFAMGADFSAMLGTMSDEDLFMTPTTADKYVMEVGREDFIPDLLAKTMKKIKVAGEEEERTSYVDVTGNANLVVLEAKKDGATTDYAEDCLIDGVSDGIKITFPKEMASDAVYSITIAPKYSLDDNAKMTFKIRLNDGVNVYTNDQLRAAYGDVDVHKINLMRNIVAELGDDQYDTTRGGSGKKLSTIQITDGTDVAELTVDVGTPYNDFDHGVYVRDTNVKDDSIVINGNYFVIDGSKLPYIDNNHDSYGADGSEYTDGLSYRISNVQVGMFLYRCADLDENNSAVRKYATGTASMSNLRIEGNNIAKYAAYYQDLKDGKMPLLKMSASYIGVVVRGGTMNMDNVAIKNTLMGFMLHGSVSGYEMPGVSKDSKVMGEVQPDETQATALNFENSIIDNSWANGIYCYDLCAMTLLQSKIGHSCGLAIHCDDRPYGGAYSGSLGYSNLNTALTMDRFTANNINNWNTGEEAWFVAYGMKNAAIGAKTMIEDGIKDATGGVMVALKVNENGQFLNFGILAKRVQENDVAAWENDKDGPNPKIDIVALDSGKGLGFFYLDDDEMMAMAAGLLPELSDYTEAFTAYLQSGAAGDVEAAGQAKTAADQKYAELTSINFTQDANPMATDETKKATFKYLLDGYTANLQAYATNFVAAMTYAAMGDAEAAKQCTADAEAAYAAAADAQLNMLLMYFQQKIADYGTNLYMYSQTADLKYAYAAAGDYLRLMSIGRPYVIQSTLGMQIMIPVYYTNEELVASMLSGK